MNVLDYQVLQQMLEHMKIILEKTDVEDDNYAPLKSAISYMNFLVSSESSGEANKWMK